MPPSLLQTRYRDGGQKERACCSGGGGTREGQCSGCWIPSSASRRKVSFERGLVPAECINCFQGLDGRSPEQRLTSSWEMSTSLEWQRFSSAALAVAEHQGVLGSSCRREQGREAGDVLLGLVPVSRDREGCLFADNGFLCPFLTVASAKMARESVYKYVLAECCSTPGVYSSSG